MESSTEKGQLRFSLDARLVLFLTLTLGITYFFEFLPALAHPVLPGWGVTALHYLGVLVPLAMALSLTAFYHQSSFQLDFWRRLIDFQRIPLVGMR